MALYSVSFGTITSHIAKQTLFTDPNDGSTYILRDLDVTLNGSHDGHIYFNPAAGPDTELFYCDNLANTNSRSFQWRGRQVFPPGWKLNVLSSSGFITVTGSGYHLR